MTLACSDALETRLGVDGCLAARCLLEPPPPDQRSRQLSSTSIGTDVMNPAGLAAASGGLMSLDPPIALGADLAGRMREVIASHS